MPTLNLFQQILYATTTPIPTAKPMQTANLCQHYTYANTKPMPTARPITNS